MPKAPAIASNVSKVGDCVPLSIAPIVFLLTLARKAKSSCEMFSLVRSNFIFKPILVFLTPFFLVKLI